MVHMVGWGAEGEWESVLNWLCAEPVAHLELNLKTLWSGPEPKPRVGPLTLCIFLKLRCNWYIISIPGVEDNDSIFVYREKWLPQ